MDRSRRILPRSAVFSALIVLSLALIAWAVVPVEAAAARGYLGVQLQELDPLLVEAFDLDAKQQGVLISDVVDDSPAQEAGLARGDVVLKFGDRRIRTAKDLRRAVRRTEPGSKVSVEVLRHGRSQTIEVTLGRKDEGREWRVLSNVFFRPQLGVQLEELDSELGRYFGTDKGLLVLDVVAGSSAEEAGVQRGDVIVEVDGESVTSMEELLDVLEDVDSDAEVPVTVLRDRHRKKLAVALSESAGRTLHLGYGDDDFRIIGPDRFGAPRWRGHRRGGEEELREDLLKLRQQIEELKERLQELRSNDDN